MLPVKDRRGFLRIALGCVGASVSGAGFRALVGTAYAQSERASIAKAALRDDLILVTGAGGNVLLLRGPDGAAMVDSGSPQSSIALVELVSEHLGGGAVDLLFNTHWHREHTGGNEAFRSAGAQIIAHENTRLWMSTEYYVDWQDRTYAPRPAAALPTETFYSSDPQPIVLNVGNEQIEYGHLRGAHTDGDIYIFFRERNVIAAGGAVTVGAYPILDHATGGWIGGLMDATQMLLEMTDADTLIVPESGPAQSRAHLEQQHEMVATVRGRVEDLMRRGKSISEMLAADVTAEFDAVWGQNRDRFISNIYDGLWWQGRLDGSL